MKELEERVIINEQSIKTAHARLDDLVAEKVRHNLNGRLHVVEAIVIGIEKIISDFIATSKDSAERTEKNTNQLIEIKTMASTFLTMMKWFFLFCGIVGSIGGSKLFGWW